MEQAKLMSVIFGCWEGGLSMRGTGGAHTHTCTRKGEGEGVLNVGRTALGILPYITLSKYILKCGA